MIVLIVAVATGLATPVGHAGSHHGQTLAGITTSAGDMAGCQHDGCPVGQHAPMQSSCFAACAGVNVLPPTLAEFHLTAMPGVLTPLLDRAMVERTIPPDPHPPKQI